MIDTDFCHLHLHGEMSILDGNNRIKEIPKIGRDLGHGSIALTDHGTLSGSLRFLNACQEQDIHGILGVETYVTTDLDVKDKETPTWHLILLAKNMVGRTNLFRMSEIAWSQGFYKKPRVDHKVLAQHSEGIIALSGCQASETCKAIESGDNERAIEALRGYRDIYRNDFYIELQPGNTPELNHKLADLGDHLSIRKTVTCDAHYSNKEFRGQEELLLIMQQVAGFKDSDKEYAKLMYDQSKQEPTLLKRLNVLWPNRKLRFDSLELHIMSRQEVVEKMNEQKFDGEELADSTLEIAAKCTPTSFATNINYLPKQHDDPDSYLRELVMQGLRKKGLTVKQEYLSRANEELALLKDKGFANYFLIVWDIVREAKARNIYMSPGRGSAGGSLVAYALGITKLDPIKYKLLFFRFLDPSRNDWPDIDMDFEHTRRDEMKDYVKDKYLNAVTLCNFSEFQAKGLVRSLARALAIPLSEVNDVCKHFMTLEEYEANDRTKSFRARHPEILGLAKQFEGQISGTGMHAAGVVMADRPLSEIIPIETRVDPEDKKRRVKVSAFDMEDAEKVNLIKFDFLGLNTLTAIHHCIDLIKERHNRSIDWENLEPNDPAVLATFNSANTTGIFQMESSAYRKLLLEMGVDNFNDLVASNALVRPGAYLTVAKDYISRKKGQTKITYPHDDVVEELQDTLGIYMYQDQIMQLAVKLGGFTWGESNKLRKIIGKKKDVKEFMPYYEAWMKRASEKIGTKEAEKMWSNFEKYSGYGFNLAHSTCYSYLGYVCGWLKYYYPLEYIYSLLKNEKKDTNRMTYLLEARRMGIKILPPSVNHSQKNMSVDGNSLRFGLEDVKQVGFAACEEIIKKRPFDSWEDFNERVAARKCNSRVIESLVAVDAFRDIKGAPYNNNAQENYQEYLNYPIALETLGDLELDIVNIEDIDQSDKSIFTIICGVTKNIKKTATYIRIDVEDITGTITVFGSMNNDLSDGEAIVCLVGSNTMLGYTRLKALTARLESGNLDNFERFLFQGRDGIDLFKDLSRLRQLGFGKLGESEKSLVMPMQIRQVTTKTGKEMCFAYLTDGEIVVQVTIFPAVWSTLKHLLFEWVPVCVKLGVLDDGGYTLWKDSVRDARTLLEKKLEKIGV